MDTPHLIPAKKSTNVRIPWVHLFAAGLVRLGAVLPSVASRAAEWLWIHPIRHERPQRELDWIRDARTERIPMGMDHLPAWTWGSGPTVLLMHGWEGRGSQMGAFVGPLVRAGFRVVAFDAPGHGDHVGRRSSLLAFADALAAASRRFGPLHAIVGHSMGGAATALALSGSLTVDRVVLVAPGDAGQALDRFMGFIKAGPVVRQRIADGMVARHGLPIEDVAAARLGASARVPALVIHDAHDKDAPTTDGLSYYDHWAGPVRWLQTEGLGHRRILRDPSVADAITDFLRSDQRRAAS